MHAAALIAASLLAGSGPGDSSQGYASLEAAAADIAPSLETGSLIFSQGDCLAVKVFTQSRYTHVAVVCVEADGVRMVYDSTSGAGVRRQPLQSYLATQAPDRIRILKPRRPIGGEKGATLQEYLESQLGRPYAINHHFTGERCEGLHCSEYATDALMAIGVVHANQPPKVSPASLLQGITQYKLYDGDELIQIARPAPLPEEGDNACEQLWIDTKLCTRRFCRKMSGWFLCR
jgi:hypothetical protein